MTTRLELDASNGKLLGVCAGLANRTGIDVTGVRLIAVLLTFFLLGPLGILAYGVTALVSSDG